MLKSVLWLLLFVPVAADDGFPETLENATSAQFEAAVQQAPDAGMRLDDFTVKGTAQDLRIDAQFVPNPDFTDWRVHVNLPTEQFRELDRKYQAEGYRRLRQGSLRGGGRRGRSGLWIREPSKSEPLQLPAGDLPIAGTRPPVGSKIAAPLDDMLADFLREHNAAGVSVAVADRGRLLYEHAVGYADARDATALATDVEMRIASLSKPITAIAILRLCEQNRLQLSDPVWPFLKQIDDSLPEPDDDRWQHITVQHLLQHTGGFDRSLTGDPMFKVPSITLKYGLTTPARIPDIIRYQVTEQLDHTPALHYAYSNFGYCVLGRVIEAVTGERYEDFIHAEILTPCGMTQTRLGKTREGDRSDRETRYHMQQQTQHAPFWSAAELNRQPDDDVKVTNADSLRVSDQYGRWDLEVMDAHGGWVSTAGDLVKLVSALDRSQQPLLSPESRQIMIRRPTHATLNDSSVWYGCGWSVRRKNPDERTLEGHNIWHAGALDGTSTLLVRRHDGLSWAVLFNTDRSTNGKRLSGLIDPLMHRAVDRMVELSRAE